MRTEGEIQSEEEQLYHHQRLLHKKYVRIIRSFQISVGLITTLLGIMGVTIVDESAAKLLFLGILSGFLMTEAALASLFILQEHSGYDFRGWREGIRTAERESAVCLAASWTFGILTTVAMVIADIFVMLEFENTTVILLAIMELICGIALLFVIFFSFWYGLRFHGFPRKDPIYA